MMSCILPRKKSSYRGISRRASLAPGSLLLFCPLFRRRDFNYMLPHVYVIIGTDWYCACELVDMHARVLKGGGWSVGFSSVLLSYRVGMM